MIALRPCQIAFLGDTSIKDPPVRNQGIRENNRLPRQLPINYQQGNTLAGTSFRGEPVALINQRSYLIDLAGRLENLRAESELPTARLANGNTNSHRVRPIRATRSTSLGIDPRLQGFLWQPDLSRSGNNGRLSQVLTAWAYSYFLPMLDDRSSKFKRRFRPKKKDTERALIEIKRRHFLPSLFND